MLTHVQMDELESVYQTATSRVDRHVIDLLTNQYKYRDYLSAFKRYLLLSQVGCCQVLLAITACGPLAIGCRV